VSERRAPHRRSDYRHFLTIQTRWMDNDAYGHVNNVVYYSFFDTVVNEYLISSGSMREGPRRARMNRSAATEREPVGRFAESME
jgi:acyl-ACP thioesterase